MQIGIETINGKLCTVIRKPFDAEWVRERCQIGVPTIVETTHAIDAQGNRVSVAIEGGE